MESLTILVIGEKSTGAIKSVVEALLGVDEYCVEYLDAFREDMFGI